ncbi:MAG TPA: LysR family transcriptional regulator [Caulobacteraceae bacterium]|nr:LysR family transcriptional regulator [Caulobacteraceae bacterium]
MQGNAHPEENSWRRLNWDDVRVFLAVADAGSLNAAAPLLGMSQPTISRRIEDLEIRLAARLFERSPRGVSLTQAGETMRELAASMARVGESIVRDVAGSDRNDVGRVRLAAPDGMASFILAPALPEFLRANPQIELSVDCGLWPDHPLAGEVDLSMDFGVTGGSDLTSTPVAVLHYALHASRDYLNTYGAPQTLAEVTQHRLVRHSAYAEQRHTWHPKAQAVGDLAGRHLVTNSSAVMLQAITNGAGIGSLPTACIAVEPSLVMLDFEPAAHLVLWLRYHSSAARQGRIKRVIEWIQRVFDPTEQPWFRKEFVHPRDFPAMTPQGERRSAPARLAGTSEQAAARRPLSRAR